ncbi:MAG: hypothetical protein AB7S38_19475 [Vulcanimicrobiota bacterium]
MTPWKNDDARRLGARMAVSPQYRGRPWHEVRPLFKPYWEFAYGYDTWNLVSETVRRAFEIAPEHPRK